MMRDGGKKKASKRFARSEETVGQLRLHEPWRLSFAYSVLMAVTSMIMHFCVYEWRETGNWNVVYLD